ncbi:MAG: hypothetical protein V3V31_10430 [Methylococcales bacterium]
MIKKPISKAPPLTKTFILGQSRKLALISIVSFLLASQVFSGELSGSIGVELRLFPHAALLETQDHTVDASIILEPEYFHEWDNRRQNIKFAPFLRLDQWDSERSHFDIRELTWLKAADEWEIRVGIGKVFWGVTESVHLVDIINQTDLIENLDTEDKLGQPMINLAVIQDWGTLDLFVLPGFRERTFPGQHGRLRTSPRVETDQPVYESSLEEAHVDFAVRWSHVIEEFDIGLSHFYGTNREPRLVFGLDGDEQPVLIPYYDIINQTALDVQATFDDWLWKLEAIHRTGQGDHFAGLAGGFEYTFVGILESAVDMGVVIEYLYDSRGNHATTPFEDDFTLALRVTFNDTQSTELLGGVVFDRDSSAKFFNLEASRRIGDNWKLELEARVFSAIPADDIQYGIRNDDYVQLSLARYF